MGFDIQAADQNGGPQICGEPAYKNKSVLYNLYRVQMLSDSEIGSIFDVHGSNISYYRNKFNIEAFSKTERARYEPAPLHKNVDQYLVSMCNINDEKFYIHRLIAVAEKGIDEVKDNVVHHKNEITFDNRPSNLEVMDKGEHTLMHAEERRNEETGRFE